MKEIKVALVGFGNVGKALARLLEKKQALLNTKYGFSTTITGRLTVASDKP